jgi:hypothetical protein
VALTRSSCIRRSNVYAGLMGSVEAVPAHCPCRLWVTLGITRIEHNESALFQ